MPTAFPEIEDLTLETVRPCTVSVELSARDWATLQAEAEKRGVTLEEYVRWRLLTSAALQEAASAALQEATEPRVQRQ